MVKAVKDAFTACYDYIRVDLGYITLARMLFTNNKLFHTEEIWKTKFIFLSNTI
jgi:hypothetical protein